MILPQIQRFTFNVLKVLELIFLVQNLNLISNPDIVQHRLPIQILKTFRVTNLL